MKNEFTVGSRDCATELLEGYIASQNLKPDDRLPSERDMCEMWDLNRTTLRSAIKRLISLGTLYSKVGSGTYVAPPKLMRDLHDTAGFGEAVRMQGREPGAKVLSFELREADKVISRKLHIMLGSKVYVLQRARYIDELPAMIETTHLSADLFPNLDAFDLAKNSLFQVLSAEYGVTLGEGDEKLSITQLDEFESKILGFPPGSPAFFQTGVISDTEGTPIEYFKSVVLSQRVRFNCELVS